MPPVALDLPPLLGFALFPPAEFGSAETVPPELAPPSLASLAPIPAVLGRSPPFAGSAALLAPPTSCPARVLRALEHPHASEHVKATAAAPNQALLDRTIGHP